MVTYGCQLHDDQRHQALEIDDMHGEGGCSYQSARGRWRSRCSGTAALGLGDDGARSRAWGRRSVSGLGTAALGLGLGDDGAVDQPGGATLCQLGRELARVPARSSKPFIVYTHRRRFFIRTACDRLTSQAVGIKKRL
jgi:hypothetical protein